MLEVHDCLIFLIYADTVHVCIITITLSHDFIIKSLLKPCEINCVTISGYYLDSLLG